MTVRSLIAACNMKRIEDVRIVNEKNVPILRFKIINALRSIASDLDLIEEMNLMVCDGFNDVVECEVLYWRIIDIGTQWESDEILEIMIVEGKENET